MSIVLLVGCKGQVSGVSDSGSEYKTISKEQFSKVIQEEEVLIVDLRTAQEFNNGAIPKAINIDLFSSTFSSEIDGLPKEKKILIYCQSGNRSGKAMNLMKSMNFEQVYELQNGFRQW